MRLAVAFVTLLALSAVVLAEDPPASQPAATQTLRVQLSASASIDEEPVAPNVIQAYVFTELHQAGLRVDSAKKTGQASYDKWIQQQVERWEKKEPGAAPASLVIEVSQTAAYNGAKFYDETQAHVFKGGVEAIIKDASGTEKGRIAFPFQWGRAIRVRKPDGSVEMRTRPDVQKEFDQIVHQALACGLLTHDLIKAGIPAKKQAKVQAHVKKLREKLLKFLDSQTESVREGELAKFLRSLPLEE